MKERRSPLQTEFVLAVAACLALLFLAVPAAPQSTSASRSATVIPNAKATANTADATAKRKAYLTQLLAMLPPSPAWNEWLQRTGELPPDFDTLPSMVDPPDPLLLEEQGRPVRIASKEQWASKRELLKEMFQHYVTGRFPPPPNNVRAEILKETTEGEITVRDVLLSFGPGLKGKLHLQLLIPPGAGPFPVFMTTSVARPWVEIALRRGYIGCIVAASDGGDDTEFFAPLYPDYDFVCLARRAWGLSRAVDYLITLPVVDKAKITFTDHSRGGKLATWAGAFDERLAAIVASSPVTGGAIPWRYCADRYFNETLEMTTRNYPHWYHPRLRFFVGRENKLPIDMHEMVALIAPRAYMDTLGINEWEVNAWGEERGFLAARRVYEFLGAKDRIALRFRPGIHPTYGSDIEEYLDWYDTVLGRRTFPQPELLLYDYSFEKWKSLSGENIDAKSYPEKTPGDLVIGDLDWKAKREQLRKNILWGLGEFPPHVRAQGPKGLTSSPPGAGAPPELGYADEILNRPRATAEVDRTTFNGASVPYSNNGNLTGELYYPRGARPDAKLPVVIWLHPYSYSTGYSRLPILPMGPVFGGMLEEQSAYLLGTYPLQEGGYMGTDFLGNPLVLQGYGVFTYDMIGFGARIPEVQRFYQRFPRWSLMGKMVDDVRSAVDMLSGNDRIDSHRIYVMGYSLGGTVALLSAALDDRIAGAVSFSGFTPLRTETVDKGTGNLENLAFIHGLIPRLGFFKGNEKRLP
jgi:pimeloyl-ACP methyl ester carboxylesterase